MRWTQASACLLIAAALCWSASRAVAQERDSSFTASITRLELAQAELAIGNESGFEKQQTVLRDLEKLIGGAAPESWRDRKQIASTVIYLLSGGSPGIVAELYRKRTLALDAEPMLKGALAYVLGRQQEALTLLGSVDPRTLDLRLAGQLAYVQATLTASHSPEKALQMLDVARLLAPGSLVEESALRRETLLAFETKDVDRGARLARQYVSRFKSSVYALDFLNRLTAAISRIDLADQPTLFEKFRPLLAAMSEADRVGFLLATARQDLVLGNYGSVRPTTREARKLIAPGSTAEVRARFYEASALLITGNGGEGQASLEAVEVAALDPQDRALLAAIKELAGHFRNPAPENGIDTTSPAQAVGTSSISKTIDEAKAALTRTSEMSATRVDP